MYDSNTTTSKIFSMCFARIDLASTDGTLASAMALGGINTDLHRSGREYAVGEEFGHDLYYAYDKSEGGGGGWYSVRVRDMHLISGGGGIPSYPPRKGN